MDEEELVETIRGVLRRSGNVVLGYLFGSRARGEAGALSDVDVAVLLSEDANRETVSGQLMDALARALRTDRIDLVLLEQAPTPLRYRIVREGKLLQCADEEARVRFVTDTVMSYLDFKPLRDRAFRIGREAILGRN
jgi:predicted nucleotidyltransferase